MPLLKAQAAAPAIKQAVVLDLGDLGAQAAKLRMAAEAHAQQILADAEAKAAKLIEEARGQGLEEGREQGHAQGLDQGQKDGQEQALAQWQEQLQNLTDAWADTTTRLDAFRRDLQRSASESILRFALRFAEKVTHRIVEIDENVITDQVANALEYVLEPLDVAVHLHPLDRDNLTQALPGILAHAEHIKHVKLVDDETISPGGCVLHFGDGRIDASIETQTRRLTDLILPPGEEEPQPEPTVQTDAAADPSAEPEPPLEDPPPSIPA
ncbi:MAG: FliH/SctL family protein [Planctomycetota bacterium]